MQSLYRHRSDGYVYNLVISICTSFIYSVMCCLHSKNSASLSPESNTPHFSIQRVQPQILPIVHLGGISRILCEWSCPLSNSSAVLVFHVFFRLQTSTLIGESYKQLLWAPIHLHLLLPRELQPLPEVHPVLLSRAHCVPSVGSQQLLQ